MYDSLTTYVLAGPTLNKSSLVEEIAVDQFKQVLAGM